MSYSATLLATPDGRPFQPVEIEVSGDTVVEVVNGLHQVIARQFGVTERPALVMRRVAAAAAQLAMAGNSNASATAAASAGTAADTAAPRRYRFVIVSDAVAARHIMEYNYLLDPDNPSVDPQGNPAAWLQLPLLDTSSRISVAAAAAPAAAVSVVGGAGVLQAGNDQQQPPVNQQVHKKRRGRDTRKIDWQALTRDMTSLVVLRICEDGVVLDVTPASTFALSAADGELNVCTCVGHAAGFQCIV
jgi:hypothetical protein